jgi:GT2 family glycosyltransferase
MVTIVPPGPMAILKVLKAFISNMQFSLVVTCYNEMRSLSRWQADVKAQTRHPDEIVIVDSASTDGTTAALRAWADADPRIRVVVQKCKPARGHNIGNEAASHEHIVSTDMGVCLDPKWFEEIVRPFEQDDSVEVVAGSYEIERESLRSAAANAEYYLENGGRPKLEPGFVPGNRSMAYTRKVWRELGGLPEDLTQYADDSVFGRQILQAGYKMSFAPAALVYWSRPARLRDFWKEQFKYGKGDGEASIKVPFAFRLHQRKLLPKAAVPLLTGIRSLQKQTSLKAVKSAVAARDLPALLVMPLLTFGNGYHFAKGYLEGDKRGEEHCQACRARLRPS